MAVANVKTNIPGPKSAELLKTWRENELPTGYQAQIAVDHAEGAVIYDVDGNKLFDYFASNKLSEIINFGKNF